MPIPFVVEGPQGQSLSAFQFSNIFMELAQDNVAAFPGGLFVGATQLTAQTIRIATVATAGDSVKLPQALPGLELMLINDNANSISVYGLGSDTIDKGATAASVAQMGNSLVIYTCVTLGQWRSEGLSTGFDPAVGLQTQAFVDGITAFAGGGQASAILLSRLLNRVSIVATAADSVKLPTAVAGLSLTVMNGAAVNSLNTFPSTGDAINALGANAAFAMAAGAIIIFYCFTNGQWFSK